MVMVMRGWPPLSGWVGMLDGLATFLRVHISDENAPNSGNGIQSSYKFLKAF